MFSSPIATTPAAIKIDYYKYILKKLSLETSICYKIIYIFVLTNDFVKPFQHMHHEKYD